MTKHDVVIVPVLLLLLIPVVVVAAYKDSHTLDLSRASCPAGQNSHSTLAPGPVSASRYSFSAMFSLRSKIEKKKSSQILSSQFTR
jgi:hypothetical protein